MIQLKKFLELLSVSEWGSAPAEIEYKKGLLTFIKQARSFVYSSAVPPGTAASSPTENSGPMRPDVFSAPFEVCAFEVADGKPLFIITNKGQKLKVLVSVVVFGPNSLCAFEMVTDALGKPFCVTTKPDMGIGYAGAVAIYRSYLDKISSCHVASEKVNERVKLRVSGEKHLIKINEVIHITESKITSERGPYGGPIDYSHRFEIRGHWRKILGIGKDRNGSYGIKGFTWVVPHEKGPEHKPLVRKQRVIHNGAMECSPNQI
jgi:hypothetical protein